MGRAKQNAVSNESRIVALLPSFLIGSAFADVLTVDGNANVLTGGLGADKLTGAGGPDTFVFNNIAEGKGHHHRLRAGTDLISISRSGFGIASGVALGTGDADDFATHYFVSAAATPTAAAANLGRRYPKTPRALIEFLFSWVALTAEDCRLLLDHL